MGVVVDSMRRPLKMSSKDCQVKQTTTSYLMPGHEKSVGDQFPKITSNKNSGKLFSWEVTDTG